MTRSANSALRTCVLTVGSTSFPTLVDSFLSPANLQTLSEAGFDTILAQIGNSPIPPPHQLGPNSHTDLIDIRKRKQDRKPFNVNVQVIQFSNELEEIIAKADLVVSHAGAGSILSFIRPVSATASTSTSSHPTSSSPSSNPNPNRQLILVPNASLMDSHQADLADEFESNNWAYVVRDPRNLSRTIKNMNQLDLFEKGVEPIGRSEIPAFQPQRIRRVLDEVLGFA